MFACVIYVCEDLKCVIPVNWVYEKPENLQRRKHYLAYFNCDPEKNPPPSKILKKNKTEKIKNNEIHKIYLYKIIGKFLDSNFFF